MRQAFTLVPLQPRLRIIALAVHLAALSLPLLATPAQAQAIARSYSIAAGPLGRALRQFAAEAGILLSADARLTQGKSSAGLQGNTSVERGLERLLVGSGLSAVRQPDGSFVVINAGATGASADGQLPQVAVVAAPTGEADGTYRAVPNASTLRGAASPLDAPQVVNVVPAQVIKDQRPRNLDDAVGSISGLTQGNTLAGTQDTIMKRGFGGNRDGSVMRNGMPLVQGRAFNATAESVEVLKGPSSLLYGLMDPGGVINIITKKPQLIRRNELSFAGSSYGGGKNGGQLTLDTTGPIGDSGLAYRLIVDRNDQNYWRNYGQIQETLVAPSLAWYGQDTQVVFSMEQREFLYPFDRGTAIDSRTGQALAIPTERRLDEPGNDMKGSSETTQLTVDHRFNHDWKAHVGLSYNREVYDARQLRVAAVNPVTGVVSRSNDGTRGALSTDSYGIAYLDGRLNLGGLRNDLQLGADIEYRKIYRAELLRSVLPYDTSFNFLNPVYGQAQKASLVSAADSDQTDLLHNQSIFVQDALHLGERWVVVAGLRYQDYSQLAGRGRPFKANTDLAGDKWLPRAGLIYKATEEISLYASYARSLKPTSTIAPLASGQVIDSNVAPEEAASWESGVKYENPEGLSGTLAVFDIKKKNVLVSQFNAGTGLTDWRTSGAARSRGLELDVTGRLNRRLSMIGSYAYLDARTTEDPLYAGLRLWNVARQTAALTLAYDVGPIIGGDKLRVGGGGRYVGDRPGDSANSFMLPSYTVADAFATYDTSIGGKTVKFQFNIKNLFDKTYYTSSANQYFVSMGDARQFTLLTALEF